MSKFFSHHKVKTETEQSVSSVTFLAEPFFYNSHRPDAFLWYLSKTIKGRKPNPELPLPGPPYPSLFNVGVMPPVALFRWPANRKINGARPGGRFHLWRQILINDHRSGCVLCRAYLGAGRDLILGDDALIYDARM